MQSDGFQQELQLQQPMPVSSSVRTYIQKLNLHRGTIKSSQAGYNHKRLYSQNSNVKNMTQQDYNKTKTLSNQQEEEEELMHCTANEMFFMNFMQNHDERSLPNSNLGLATMQHSQTQKALGTAQLGVIPDEQEINRTFRFKLPVLVSQIENPNSSFGLLNGWQHNFIFIEVS